MRADEVRDIVFDKPDEEEFFVDKEYKDYAIRGTKEHEFVQTLSGGLQYVNSINVFFRNAQSENIVPRDTLIALIQDIIMEIQDTVQKLKELDHVTFKEYLRTDQRFLVYAARLGKYVYLRNQADKGTRTFTQPHDSKLRAGLYDIKIRMAEHFGEEFLTYRQRKRRKRIGDSIL